MVMENICDFTVPLSARERRRSEFRERLARAAREMHFAALSSDAVDSAAVLAVAGNLAGLAMSIPLDPFDTNSPGLNDDSVPTNDPHGGRGHRE